MIKAEKKKMSSDFERSNWADPRFAEGYRDTADVIIVERARMLSVLQSFYVHFVKNGPRKKILDLGCGDGIVTSAIAAVDDTIVAILVDGSKDMIAKARERLKGLKQTSYIQASLQEITRKDLSGRSLDFVASSLAIHHLTLQEKETLFRKIYGFLNPGGYFVNIDVVLAPTRKLEAWYLSLWQDWIIERTWDLGLEGRRFDGIIRKYKDENENKPDTLRDQLAMLRTIGFTDVDCYYQYGIFAVYGGKK